MLVCWNIINPSRYVHFRKFIKIKLTQIFIFTLRCGASKGFMKTFKAFIKPFEAPQKSVKIKIQIIFFFFVRDQGEKC